MMRGFTLMEVMIVTAIVAILAAFAIPSYTDHIARTHRADGQKAMSAASLELEQIYADKRLYPTAATFTPQGTAKMPLTYAPSADRRGYALLSSGVGTQAGYYLATNGLATNGQELRCYCDKCGGSTPFGAFSSNTTVCPGTTVRW